MENYTRALEVLEGHRLLLLENITATIQDVKIDPPADASVYRLLKRYVVDETYSVAQYEAAKKLITTHIAKQAHVANAVGQQTLNFTAPTAGKTTLESAPVHTQHKLAALLAVFSGKRRKPLHDVFAFGIGKASRSAEV